MNRRQKIRQRKTDAGKQVIKYYKDYSIMMSNANDEKRHKKLTPYQMLHKLPIHLAEVKAGNTSENLLN